MWWECVDCGVRTYDLGIPASCTGCGGASFSQVRDEVFTEEVPLDDFEPDEDEVLERLAPHRAALGAPAPARASLKPTRAQG